tara:strand:- start:58 stop:366 length:309 start_codon:yes stop_codon:yes gene_type:complete
MSEHPIMDKAEVAIDLPNRLYRGTFRRDVAFEMPADDEVFLKLIYAGEESRIASVHLHYFLLADIIKETALEISEKHPIDDVHREPLLAAARELVKALEEKG